MKNFILYLIIGLTLVSFIAKAQTVDTLTIQSKVFGQTRKVKVMLPSGYNDYPNTEKNYIVAYLFDAQSEDFFNFYKSTVNYLVSSGYIQPLILVGIASDNRQYEFTPKAQTEAGIKYFRKSGGADTLALHMQNEVLPLIKKKYRCNGYNVAIGHSLGGTFVIYSLLKYPNLFNAGIVISPNLEYDKEGIVSSFDNLANTGVLNHKFIFLAHGSGDRYEDDFKKGTEKVDSILNKKNIEGLRFYTKKLDNNSHGTTAMEGIFKGLITLNAQFVLSDKQFQILGKDKSPSFIQDLKAYYNSTSEWAGIQLPAVDEINRIAYNFFYINRLDQAIEVFKWGLSIYPKNINLYDSMGEMQQNASNKAAALKYYNEAIELINKKRSILGEKTYTDQISWYNGRIKSISKPDEK